MGGGVMTCHKWPRIDHAEDCLNLICPACNRYFSVPCRGRFLREVSNNQLLWGFFGERFISTGEVQ